MSENGRIYEKDNGARAITACLSGRGRLFTMGLILFVVLGSIGLGVGAVAGASIDVKVTQIDVGPDGVWITSDITATSDEVEVDLYVYGEDIPVPTFYVVGEGEKTSISSDAEATAHVVAKLEDVEWDHMQTMSTSGAACYGGITEVDGVTKTTCKWRWVPDTPGTYYCRVSGQYAKASGESAGEISEVEMFLVPTETPQLPGFEAVFAIAGLLAVAYLVHRRKK